MNTKLVENTFLYMAENNHEIPGIIKEVSKNLAQWNSETLIATRREFARKHGYDGKLELIEKLLPSSV